MAASSGYTTSYTALQAPSMPLQGIHFKADSITPCVK
jgi:hypothetical protein